MSHETYPITGILLKASRGIPARQEITAWYNDRANEYQVTLFMLALKEFMNKPVEERISYFQVAGIHCYPLVGWDGENAITTPEKSTDPFPGYCSHNRVTFPTWHRPYMLLFEQALHEIMLQLVGRMDFPHTIEGTERRSNFMTALMYFRLPYWDWAQKQTYIGNYGLPQICTTELVDIINPSGAVSSVSNPLYRFTNPKGVAMGDRSMGDNAIRDNDPNEQGVPGRLRVLPWSKCVATSRFGILAEVGSSGPEPDWIQGVNNWQYSNRALADPRWYGGDGGSLADAVNRMLSDGYFDSWETFSSTRWNNPRENKDFLSLEYIHNVVHNVTGGTFMADKDIPQGTNGFLGLGLGHMSDVPVAAFDPIFWLHHCNMDRLLAIWQTLNPNKWFDKPKPASPPDPLPSDPLVPFHYDSNKSRWDSNRTRDWLQSNYDYDTLVPRSGVTRGSPEYLEDLRKQLYKLYPSTSSIIHETPGYTLPGQKFNDFIINVVYDRYALRGRAYSILFFIGKPPSPLSSYRHSENFVGSVYTFSSPVENADGSAACANCAQQSSEKVLSKAQIPITLALLSKAAPSHGGDAPQVPVPGIGLDALDPDLVKRLLHDPHAGLSWEFVALGGDRVDRSAFPDTEIAVLHGTGTHGAEASQLPVYHKYKILREATDNKEQGVGFAGNRLHLIVDDPDV